MKNMKQLKYAIDSLRREVNRIAKRVRNESLVYFQFPGYIDTGWKKNDTLKFTSAKKFDQLLPDSIRSLIDEKALGKAQSAKSMNDILISDYEGKKKDLRLHQIEWHRKITLSIACLVLFLIGAPLGSIIRKGGLGSPLIFAIVFFMIFYFLSNTGQKFSKEGTMSPFAGMWLSTFVLVPIGIFLTYKAMRDSQLFSKEFYFRLRGNIRKILKKGAAKKDL
jgi:lipopolysaccharide export system permease protein